MMESVNIYQYPTQVILFSENQSFGDSIAFSLAHTRRIKTFRDPRALALWIENNIGYPDPMQVRIEANRPGPRRYFSVETDRIYSRAFDKGRFAVPAVLVVTNDNDKIDGLTLCRQLADFPIKKILLLNKFRDFDAIDALNEGIIDQCIGASDRDILNDLEIAIKNMEMRHFQEKSIVPLQILTKSGFNFLSDKKFARLIEEVITENSFAEYYWFDHTNGILFVNPNGECKLMVIETEASMINHLEDAQDAGAPRALREALRDFRLIPLFVDGDERSSPQYDKWESYCRPAQRCETTQPIFWALFEFPKKYSPGEIYSFNEHLQSIAEPL
jgi:hypothetical protein